MKNLISSILMTITLVMMSACGDISPTQAPLDNSSAIATIVGSTMSAYSTLPSESNETPIPTVTLPTSMSYENKTYRFAFEYPLTWSVTETIVPKGTRLAQRSFNRFDAGSEDYEVLIIEVAKGSEWILEMTAINSMQNCGGYSTDLIGLAADTSIYQPLEILGRKAVRLRPENGYAWKAPDAPEPYPVIVAFPNELGECPSHGTDWMLFSIGNNQMPLSLYLTYYSTYFTNVNLQNRTIDYSVIQEMDEIVESLKFLIE